MLSATFIQECRWQNLNLLIASDLKTTILTMKTLYPEIQPYHTFFLATDTAHQVYVEESGNPTGFPVIFLHGGPCSGTKPDHRRFFNPQQYRIILFDQRGCGQSTPFGRCEDNTTQALIADMERIRCQLTIQQWLVFGGSWGGALALLYAQQHPQYVAGLIIRAVFLARQDDLNWYIQDGAKRIFPEAWQTLISSLKHPPTDDLLAHLLAALENTDISFRDTVLSAWLNWSAQVALGVNYQSKSTLVITEDTLQQVRMELHYAKHRYFITENQILANCPLLQEIPTQIIHSRLDLLCPLEAGYRLHQALPNASFCILNHAGHIAQHEEMIDALVTATDSFASNLKRDTAKR